MTHITAAGHTDPYCAPIPRPLWTENYGQFFFLCCAALSTLVYSFVPVGQPSIHGAGPSYGGDHICVTACPNVVDPEGTSLLWSPFTAILSSTDRLNCPIQ